jgi:hypothetical protein
MKKSLSAIALAALCGALPIASAASTILYTEDWGTTNGGKSFAAVGWTSVVASSDNPPYVGFFSAGTPTDSSTGNPLPAETAYYTGLVAGQNGMFYTVAGAGAGSGGDTSFNPIDPTQFQNVTLSVEASDEGTAATNYFAVQVGGAWYVSATALMGSDPTYPEFTLASTPYKTLASAWNQLTINANSVTIGSLAATNLSGPITGVGIVQVGPGGWNYNEVVISATPSPIVYTEDWGTTNGGKSFAAVGWTSVVASPDSPPYVGFFSAGTPTDSSTGNPLPAETAYYTGLVAGQNGMFYTVAGSGAGSGGDSSFNAIDSTQHPGLALSVEASDEGTTAANYFAVQVGAAWYVSTTALTGSDPTYPEFTLASTPYTTLASAWDQLTINANSVTIGPVAAANLSGPITGVGIVQVGPGGWNYNEIVISASVPPNSTPPSATIYTEDWGTAFYNATGTAAGTLAAVGWSSAGIAYTGMYAAPGSIDPGTGVTFPPPPIGNINGTNNALYASLDGASSIGVFYTTDTNGNGADGDSSFADINPANYPGGVVLNADSQFNSTTLSSNYFAVQIGAIAGVGGQWYVSTNAFATNAPGNPFFALNSLVFNPLSNDWYTLTFPEGALNATGSVTIGGVATNNLSGLITGIGIVVVGNPDYAGGTTGYGINYATFSVTTPLAGSSGAVAPKIDASGFSQTAYAGGNASFAVDAFVGTAPLTYTWTFKASGGSTIILKNGITGTGSFISGAAANLITLSNVSSADAGSYSVEVGNLYGADYSTNYTTNTLTVNPLPSDILYATTFPFVGPFHTGESPTNVGWFATLPTTDNPNRLDESGSLYAYETTATTTGFFTSSASDVPGLSGLPFTNINPANFPSMSFRATIANPTANNASIYFAVEMAGGQWYVSSSSIQIAANRGVYNTYGLQFSPAMLEWNTLTLGASSATIGSPATADLTGDIIGAGVVFVFNGTAAEYDLDNFELVTDSTPPVLPSFPSEPDVPYPQTVYAGGGASFYFTEAGTLPLTNRWQFDDNGVDLTDGVTATRSIISGSQTTELTIQNVSGADQGTYDPTVSNPAGTANVDGSEYGPPMLTVISPPIGLIYSESFPLYKPATANQPFSLIGWTNQSDVSNRIFQIGTALVGTGAAYAYEPTQTNSLFYASTASDTGYSGLPFVAFDPANYPAGSIQFSTSMEAGNAQYTNVSASFAVEQGGQWYAMATPVEPTNPPTALSTSAYATLASQTYSPAASQWKTLTLVGTAGVIVGGTPAQNLSGPITAAGLLFQHFGTSGGDINYNSFVIQATGFIGGLNIGSLVNGSVTLTWVGNPAVSLQSSTDLIHWAAVPNTTGDHMLTVSATGTNEFFRVVGLLP